MKPRLAVGQEGADQLAVGAQARKRNAESFGQRTYDNNIRPADTGPSQAPASTMTIRGALSRLCTQNAQGLTVVHQQKTTGSPNAVQIFAERRDAAAAGACTVGHNDGTPVLTRLPTQAPMQRSNIVVGKSLDDRASVCSSLDTPTGDRISPRVHEELGWLASQQATQIPKEMQRGRSQDRRRQALQSREAAGHSSGGERCSQRRWPAGGQVCPWCNCLAGVTEPEIQRRGEIGHEFGLVPNWLMLLLSKTLN